MKVDQNGFEASAEEKAVSGDGELLPGDFYTEGPYMVFTAQYLLRRGYCCNSDCRHCPYREASDEWLVVSG